MVLFKIRRGDAPVYEADCRLWKREAAKQPGFRGYKTLFRTNEPGQVASFYLWKKEADHKRFMKKHHDRLVSLSRCPVKVLGYFNFETAS